MKNILFSSNKVSFKNVLPCLALLIIISALLFGCSGKSDSAMYEPQEIRSAAADYSLDERALSNFEGTGFDSSTTARSASASAQSTPSESSPARNRNPVPEVNIASIPGVERKLVKKADLRIEADPSLVSKEGKLLGVNQKIDTLIKKYGAYSENTYSDEDSAEFTLRVPKVYYESFISETGILGTVKSRTETAEDVTIQFFDLEGRLNTRKALLATFQSYISRAKDIDDIMKIETRIAALQNEIDTIGNQFTRLGNLVDYATVHLTIFSNYRHIEKPYTLGDRIKELFSSFGEFASSAFIVILGAIVYAGPIIIVFLIAFWLLFGRVGILKKAFRYATETSSQAKDKKTLLNGIMQNKKDTKKEDKKA